MGYCGAFIELILFCIDTHCTGMPAVLCNYLFIFNMLCSFQLLD